MKSPEDAGRFAAAIASLAVACRIELDDPTVEVYFRGLQDIPIVLIERSARELEREATFFPKVAEWRMAVDRVVIEEEHAALTGGQRPLLPGEVHPGAWRCPDCDNTGFVQTTISCVKLTCHPMSRIPQNAEGEHQHSAVSRCTESHCASRRQQAAARRRRYGKKED